MFVDRVTIEVQGGRGGNGCVSFRREKYVPHGGPDGGDGGNGGSVIIVARNGVNNLAALAHHRFWRADAGSPGSGANKQGKSAEDLIIEVPPGTLVIDARGGFTLKDLTHDGDNVIAARGGTRGRGNASFKTATNRAPRDSTPGGEGERRELLLELKVIADVGLIGKPNAGKSTLLSRLTRARPAIADYPFTTKHPNLGIVNVDGDRQFVMADIPGLIEGAHTGAGLGHEFLRHIERAGILVHLVEPLPTDDSDPFDNYRVIREELTQYDEQLARRPEILVVSKAELPGAEELRVRLAESSGREVLLISAVTGQGLNELVRQIDHLLAEQREPIA
jgi:GTPase